MDICFSFVKSISCGLSVLLFSLYVLPLMIDLALLLFEGSIVFYPFEGPVIISTRSRDAFVNEIKNQIHHHVQPYN